MALEGQDAGVLFVLTMPVAMSNVQVVPWLILLKLFWFNYLKI